MDDFDDILRRNLSNPDNIPDSGSAWNKVNKVLNPGIPKIWRTIALFSLLLWLLTFGYIIINHTDNTNKNAFTKIESKPGQNNSGLKNTIPAENNSATQNTLPGQNNYGLQSNKTVQIVHDTIIKHVYITKWKTADNKSDNIAKASSGLLETKDSISNTSQLRGLELTQLDPLSLNKIESQTKSEKEKLNPLAAQKLSNALNKNQLPRFEIGAYVGQSNYFNYVSLNPDIAPVIESERYALALRYRIWKGLGVNTSITKHITKYKAASIKEAADIKAPNLGTNYQLESINVNQTLFTISNGLSYHFRLKNQWTLGLTSGFEWILSGSQSNIYYYPGGPYTPEKYVTLINNAKIFKPETFYTSLGVDIPIYNRWQLSGRFKKHYIINKNEWVLPSYSGEIGINFYFN